MTRHKPMHRQIADQLRQRIAAGRYAEHGLPPELSLMEEFGVSRHTVRSALQWLVNDGLIERRAGQGTRVANRRETGFWVVGSLDDLIGEFTVDQYLTLSAEMEPARRHPAAAALFKIPKTRQIFHILRILTLRDLPYALTNVYASAANGALIPPQEIGAQPLIKLVERYGQVRADRLRQLVSATAADDQTARQLGIPVGAPVLVLHRTYFVGEAEPLVHAELFCRPDRYQQVVDFVHEPGSAAPTPEPARQKAMHQQIADRIRHRISCGQYAGDGLPPELVLMEEFGVSRHTVRAALQSLVTEGLIERRAGLGTRVTSRGRGAHWMVASLTDVIGDFSVDQYRTLGSAMVPARNHPSPAALFAVPKGRNLFRLQRILTVDELPYALAGIYTTDEYGTLIPSGSLDSKPLIELVEHYGGVRATRVRQLASAASADQETARHLGIAAGSPVLVLHRTYFNANDEPIVHAELFCRPDRYEQRIDFAHGSPGA